MSYCTRLAVAFQVAVILSATISANLNRTAAAIDLPLAGVNASNYAYSGTALPFVDVGHMGDQWHSMQRIPSSDAPHEIPLTSDGYPSSLLPGEFARSLIYLGNGGIYPTGLYTVQWTGNGQVQLWAPSGSTLLASMAGKANYNFSASATNPGVLMLDITQTDPLNPVRDIRVRAAFPGTNGSSTFNPVYKSDLANYGVVRHLGWGAPNNSKVSTWSQRTEPNDFHWGSGAGVPYEYQIQLSNETKEDLWLNVPHMADDDFVRNLALLVRQKLNPGLRVWVEYSNEVWNPGFKQFQYAAETLMPKYGLPNPPQAYGRRSAEIFDIFSTQITDPKRLVRVIAGQNGSSWVLDQALTGATVNGTLKADVAAVAPYFTVDIDMLYQQHLNGTVNLDNVFTELHSNIDTIMNWAATNRDVAAARGLPLVAYEGGQHLVARPGEQHNDLAFVDLLINLNRDPRMGDLYKYMLDEWYAAGGKTFVFVGETIRPTKWGTWGLKEHYLDNDAVKFRAVQDYLKALQPKQGDFNKDGAVDPKDYELWRSLFGTRTILTADGDKSGYIDGGDYVVWRKSLASAGSLALAATPVPEPGVLLIIAEVACLGAWELSRSRFLASASGRSGNS